MALVGENFTTVFALPASWTRVMPVVYSVPPPWVPPEVVENFNGVFVSNRDYASLLEKITYVMNNYNSIQKRMETNKLTDTD